MQTISQARRPRRGRLAVQLAVGAALIVPFGGALAFADTPTPTPSPTLTPTPTLAPSTTPVASTTPATPTPTPTPAAPSISGAATTAQVGWTLAGGITEEHSFGLTVAGTIDGQATAHIAMLDTATASACPSSPLYPQQTATGARITVTPNPQATPVLASAPGTPTATPATTPVVLGGLTTYTLSYTPKDSGYYHLCGWLVGSPAYGDASTVSRFDQVVGVGNRPATINATIPDAGRSADFFSIKVTGSVEGTGRRVLIMGEPDHGQRCDQMRKLASGKRPLQSVTAVSGNFSKTIKVRFASKAAGAELVCAQIVETVDRNPEATASHTMTIGETLKCTTTQAAITQTVNDLRTIRSRRDAALARLSAAKKRLKPLKARVTRQRSISDRRIATARKAMRRAKSAAGRKKASRHLAAVKKTEQRRIYNAGAGLRKENGTIRGHQRSYSQYRTGANLLNDTLTRTRKDLTKYCSPAGRKIS